MRYSRLELLSRSTSGFGFRTSRTPEVVAANRFPTRCIHQTDLVGVLNNGDIAKALSKQVHA